MSEAQGLDIEVFVKLLDEGTDVWRPVPARKEPDGAFRLCRPEWYEPEAERWEFPPDTRVRCETKVFSDGMRALVAVSEVS